ncbi:hypothetical protein AVEN_234148-1 [Araneus ventricosus]|uniref:Uncharacterized protein n=1 Tax=Araneus ventricosus TaxID=182803 RepID=A0A4Y2NBA3_ARAVE|nr:hypothetical protein AVEN_234148-1 [Araneus ventricosus]
MERLRKLLAEVKTDEDPYFDNKDNGPEDDLEEFYSNHEYFSDQDNLIEKKENEDKQDLLDRPPSEKLE